MLRLESVFLIFIVIASISFAFIGCESKNNLTRSKAEELIEKSQIELKKKIHLHENGVQIGLQHNLWYQEKAYFTTNILLSKRGAGFFEDISGSFLTLKQPLDIKAEVTGIADAILPLTDSKGVKEAQFIWRYVNIASPVKWVITDGGKGKAYFRLYDDGWRLEGFDDIKYNDSPIQLSSGEVKEEQSDREAIQKKIEELQRAETERIRKEEEMRQREKVRLAQLITESKSPSKTIGLFNCINTTVVTGGRPQANGEAILTDVDASYVHHLYTNYNYTVKVVFWFGNINSIYKQDSPPTYRVSFKLKNDIQIRPGNFVYGIWFMDKQTRDNFYNKILDEKAKWDKKYPELK